MTAQLAARRALEQLRLGLLAPQQLAALTAGGAHLIRALEAALDQPHPQLTLVGAYGQGKTHTLHYLRDWALHDGWATSLIQLDPRQRPLHDAREVYRAVMASLRLPGDAQLLPRLRDARAAHPNLPWPPHLPHRWRCLLDAATRAPTSTPLRFNMTRAVAQSYISLALHGQLISSSALKQVFQFYDVPDHKNGSMSTTGTPIILSALAGLSDIFMNFFGLKGWIVFIDEVESIGMMGRARRLKNYELLREWGEGAPGRLVPVLAVTPEFVHRISADGAEPGVLGPMRHVLTDPPPDEWAALCQRLAGLHADAYGWRPQPAAQARLMELVRASVGRELRLRLKLLVGELDLAEQAAR